MGSRGPIPKRSDQRAGHVTKAEKAEVDKLRPSRVSRPPESGAGSSVKAWRRYAESVGVVVGDQAGRDEIIAAVDDAGPDDSWHPIAVRWFRSLEASGQSRFFEPSDWAAARYVAEVMTKNLESGRFSATLFSSVWSAMTDLLTTEGARRRARIEIEREDGSEDASEVAVMDYYRNLGVVNE